MEIILNITEDSQVELVKDGCEAVQGENNVTVLNINFPETIKGYSIDNYIKQIEFGECKELGECVKFLDRLEGNTYELCDTCTQFKKLMIQFTLKNLVDEAEPIIWKTKPFALEFCESINAENNIEVQAQFLGLAEVETEWENYIKANTLRMVYKVGDVPTADATSLGDTIFYLGANTTEPYTLTYGHYYRCNYINNAYEWTDLTQDPSLEGVANGVREINKNQTIQFWVGDKEELGNEVIQENVGYIPIDQEIKETFDEVLSEMKEDENYELAYPIKKDPTNNYSINYNGCSFVAQQLLFKSNEGVNIVSSSYQTLFKDANDFVGRHFKILLDIKSMGQRYIEFIMPSNEEIYNEYIPYTFIEDYADGGKIILKIIFRGVMGSLNPYQGNFQAIAKYITRSSKGNEYADENMALNELDERVLLKEVYEIFDGTLPPRGNTGGSSSGGVL